VRRADHDKTKARAADILAAALRCFARTGFSAASMRDIAKEAGVSLGLLYRYYEDKAAIVGAAVEADSGEFQARLSACAAAGPGAEALVDFLVEEVALRAEPAMFALASEIVAEAARAPAIAAHIRRNIEAAETALADALRALPGRNGAEASRILGLVDHLALRQFLGLEADSRAALVAALAGPR
jgi:TetR/AcrR family transcriptional regulator, repressor for uid operon